MSIPAPHFRLYPQSFRRRAKTAAAAAESRDEAAGRWRFVLESVGGDVCLEAADDEAETSSERLELLAIVRGLEALDQPSRVTLFTERRSIAYGFRFGLAVWRDNDWQWERFGRMTDVKDADLWRRIDQALEIHNVQCRLTCAGVTDDLAAPPKRIAPATRAAGNRKLRIDTGHATPPMRTPTPTHSKDSFTGWLKRWLPKTFA